ncbi:xylitol dehydrogenase [Fomitiporia mediterranea MF3/22]|uniref:xylitol dehydrogenase n=1 Tax=Fomitiporia mediterranea (strain MF3/22) TaxID=694068 RepID=UPI0004408C01|nr:xylitol dehydrogenase [Fomitiporia mediterranea MF3/22]EJD02434.1 xylitol dehydrogenase [Fomitiporia mediterranea MF3/22]
MSDNKAFILNGPLDATFGQRPIPELDPDEVLIAVKKTGICGSDMHNYVEGRIGANTATQPFVLGHEASGVIEKIGARVKNVKVGDRVAMEPGVTCRKCWDCKNGKYQLCQHVIFASSCPVDGTLKRYHKLPSDLTYKLPDHLTLEDGAMIEPLSVAVHAVSATAHVRAGQNVVVFGAGPVGLLCMAVARALGAHRVIGVDIVPTRLEFALNYAATETFLAPPRSGESAIEYSKKTAEMMKNALGVEERGPNSINVALDATGAETCIQVALLAVRAGGTVVQVGFGAQEVQIPITALLVKEITFKGSICYGPGDYTLAMALASSRKVDLKPLVTHRFKFEDAIAAFETTRAGRSIDSNGQITNVIKTIISGPDVDPAAP